MAVDGGVARIVLREARTIQALSAEYSVRGCCGLYVRRVLAECPVKAWVERFGPVDVLPLLIRAFERAENVKAVSHS